MNHPTALYTRTHTHALRGQGSTLPAGVRKKRIQRIAAAEGVERAFYSEGYKELEKRIFKASKTHQFALVGKTENESEEKIKTNNINGLQVSAHFYSRKCAFRANRTSPVVVGLCGALSQGIRRIRNLRTSIAIV